MKTFLTTLAVLTAVATPAFAQSFCIRDDGTGNVLTFSHKSDHSSDSEHCNAVREGCDAFAMVPSVRLGLPIRTVLPATGGGSSRLQ